MSAVAVFDLDNTLVRGSSLFHFGKMLLRRRVIRASDVVRYSLSEARYVMRLGEPAGISASVAERVLSLVKGASCEQMRGLAEEFVATRLDAYLESDVVRELDSLSRLGVRTILATASPQELADPIAARLGMTVALGTVGEVIDGRYSGRLWSEICHGEAKALRVRDQLRQWAVDPADVVAFSDSVNDLPLLALVGTPVATKPDIHLRRIAQRNGWQIFPEVPQLQTDWREAAFPLLPF